MCKRRSRGADPSRCAACELHSTHCGTDPGVSGASLAMRLEAKRARAGGRALCAPADDAVLAMRHGGGGTCAPLAFICAFCKADAG